MKIRSIALLAISLPFSVCAANLSMASLAVYNSWDSPPSVALVTEMEAEVSRIFAAAGVRVTWRTLTSPRKPEDFPAIVIFRFHGVCSFDRGPVPDERSAIESGFSLAKTDVVDGQVLPFATVDCDGVRRFIAPDMKYLTAEQRNARLGRALARVSAHEIYHMLTKSERHTRIGIARASFSRSELTAPTFFFAQKETAWLRAWGEMPIGSTVIAEEQPADSPDAESTQLESGTFVGR